MLYFDSNFTEMVQLIIIQHGLDIGLVRSGSGLYLNKWWPVWLMHICVTRLRWVNKGFMKYKNVIRCYNRYKILHLVRSSLWKCVKKYQSLTMSFVYKETNHIICGAGNSRGLYFTITNNKICEIIKIIYFNSLGPSDAIWWQKTGSTLAQVMACCLTAMLTYHQ